MPIRTEQGSHRDRFPSQVHDAYHGGVEGVQKGTGPLGKRGSDGQGRGSGLEDGATIHEDDEVEG
jgi:hypothetical protein